MKMHSGIVYVALLLKRSYHRKQRLPLACLVSTSQFYLVFCRGPCFVRRYTFLSELKLIFLGTCLCIHNLFTASLFVSLSFRIIGSVYLTQPHLKVKSALYVVLAEIGWGVSGCCSAATAAISGKVPIKGGKCILTITNCMNTLISGFSPKVCIPE